MSLGIFIHDFDVVKPDGTVSLKSSSLPTQQQHLASKQYVDTAVAEGGGDWLASVLSVLATPPGSPSDGDRHLVAGSGATGAWAGKENQVAQYELSSTSWIFTSPSFGTHVYVEGGSTFAGNTIIYVADTGGGSAGWVTLGNVSGALLKANNLDDVQNTTTARSNLGLGSLATANSVDLAGDVGTTVLPVANGGTGSATAPMIGIVTAADAAAVKTILGIGSIASQSASNVSITGGSITGITDLAVADGGTGASTAADARTNLGLGTAAVLDSGTDSGKVIKLDGALSSSQFVARWSDSGIVVTSDANFSGLYGGANWTVKDGSTTKAEGTIIDADAASKTIYVTYTTGGSYDISSGYTFESYGNSWTTATSPTTSADRVRGAGSSLLKEVIGDAGTGEYGSKGLAKFDADDFAVNSGLVSIRTGIDPSGDAIAKFVSSVTDGDLVVAVSWWSGTGNLISSNAIDTSAKTVKTQTDVTSAIAGQSVQISGYTFELASAPTNDGTDYVMTFTSSTNMNYLYDGSAFSVLGGGGLATGASIASAVSASAGKLLKVGASNLAAGDALSVDSSGLIVAKTFGTAADENVATALASSASTVLKVSAANLASGDVLAVDASANIVAATLGTAASEDVATALNATNGKLLKVASAANLAVNNLLKIDANGEIVGTTEAGTGTVTSVNLEDGAGQTGTAITASGSFKIQGGTDGIISTAISADTLTLNASVDGHDISGPVVESSGGILTAIPTLPTNIDDLDGVYALDLSGIAADGSMTLPKVTAAAKRGAKVTIKILDIASGKKCTVHAPSVTGGAKMLIDGYESIDLTTKGQSLTVHYSDFMTDTDTANATKLSMV